MIASAYHNHSFEASSLDIRALNKAYVLLVNELTKVYARNKELTGISPTPAWKYIDAIEGAEWEINEYIYENQNDAGQGHNAQVNKLCIISGTETPLYTTELNQIVKDADRAIAIYRTELNEEKRKYAPKERGWFIQEYTLSYRLDGLLSPTMTNI